MNGQVKTTIEFVLTIGRLLSCWADKVELHNYSPNTTSSSCPNKLIHEVDNLTVTFKVDFLGLTPLDTALFEVMLVRDKDVFTEFARTLHKWRGYPPNQFEVKGPCSHAPTNGTHFLLKCNIKAHCEIGHTFVFLSLRHLEKVYKSLYAEIPKVYATCADDDEGRQDFTVIIDDKDVPRRPNCSMMMAAGAYYLLELCARTRYPQMVLEIRRGGELVLQSRTGCAVVNTSFKVTPEEFAFTARDTCGLRGRLKCRFGIAQSNDRFATVLPFAILVLTPLVLISSVGLWIFIKLMEKSKGDEVECNEAECREEPKKETVDDESSVDDVYTSAMDRKRSYGHAEVDTFRTKNSIDNPNKRSSHVGAITSKKPSNVGEITNKRPSNVSEIASKRPSYFGKMTSKRSSNLSEMTSKRPSIGHLVPYQEPATSGGTFVGTSELTPTSVHKLPVKKSLTGTRRESASKFVV